MKKFIEDDYRKESGTLREEIANLQGQLMRAEKVEFHALDYQHDLLWTSKGALLLLLVCVVVSVPNLYGYMITLCALMAVFFVANALLSLVTFGSLLYFIELPNIFLVTLSLGIVIYRWIFALSIKSVTSWAVNVLVSVVAVFAVANWVAGVNLEHSRLHVIAFIAERAAYRRHRKAQ